MKSIKHNKSPLILTRTKKHFIVRFVGKKNFRRHNFNGLTDAFMIKELLQKKALKSRYTDIFHVLVSGFYIKLNSVDDLLDTSDIFSSF